jgi:CHAT domain-containing protein
VVLVDGQKSDKDGLAIFELAPSDQLAEQVSTLIHPSTLTSTEKTKELGADAYAALLGALSNRIQRKDLVIVPSGLLSYLPFELLFEPADRTGREGQFLAERHRIRYAPSLTALNLQGKWDKARASPDRTLFAIGDPVYDRGDVRAGGTGSDAASATDRGREYALREGGRGYPRLVHSGAEVQGVGKLLRASKEDIHTGLEATETVVKQASESGQLAHSRYLHFATHGIMGVDTGAQPALVLGLVGDPREDGFLQLDEVTGLKLNADLVVLSACRSGQGQLYNGEGVKGLARAFLFAGGRGVLCSLWQVDDQETARLMVKFYSNLQRGRPAAEALQSAKLDMIHQGKAPCYWAPFVLVGE